MELQPERVALPQRAGDLHHVGQDQRDHRHSNQRIHQINDTIGTARGPEVTGTGDRHAAAPGVERGEEVCRCWAISRLHAHPEAGMDDEPRTERQAASLEQDIEEENGGAAES